MIIALGLMATNHMMDIIILSHPQDNVNRQIYLSIARKIICRVTNETVNVAYVQTDEWRNSATFMLTKAHKFSL